MRNLIFTGRFQPLHMGHIQMIRKIKEIYPDDLLLICILRNTVTGVIAREESAFHEVSKSKQRSENNPLPNWNRYMLVKLAVEAEPTLAKNTVIIFRDRSDVDWDKSVADLPEDRTFVLPGYSKERFDTEKLNYYRAKGEDIVLVNTESASYSATEIRAAIKSGSEDLSFLPEACREYFIHHCKKYFI